MNPVEESRYNGTLTLTINNPPVNALSSFVVTELRHALGRAERDSNVKEIVIRGAGDEFFSAGADISELKAVVESDNPLEAGYKFSLVGQELVVKILSHPKRVKAFINGYCFGGGFELALACHSREVVSHAWLGLPEVRLGIIPGWGGLELLLFKFNIPQPSGVLRIAANGILLEASDPIWRDISRRGSKVFEGVVDTGKTLKNPNEHITVSGYALASSETLCYRADWLGRFFKRQGLSVGANWQSYVSIGLATQFGLVCSAPHAREGINAFLEKRAPDFTQFEN